MLKSAGLVMILLLGGYFSWSSVATARQNLSGVSAWIRLLRIIREEIDCFSRPVNEILSTVDPETAKQLGSSCGNATLPLLYQSSHAGLDADSQRLLRALIDTPSGNRREDEVKRFDACISALEEQQKRLAQALPQKIKLYTTLYFSASLGIVILLW